MVIPSASLKVAELDLAAARSHVQQFKEISQANEEALASLNATYDEYKSTTESQLSASWVNFTLRESILTTAHLFLLGPTRIPSEDSEEC